MISLMLLIKAISNKNNAKNQKERFLRKIDQVDKV